MVVNSVETEYMLRREVARLSDEFQGVFGQETIDRYVRESLGALEGARVKSFIPVFVQRFSRERLKALAQAQSKIAKDRPEILFVCTHNAGRSQMAAALLQQLAGDRVSVRSAGSTPANEVNPVAVAAMTEIGLDLSEAFLKLLTDEVVRAADVVITMGCGDACPIYPGKKYEDWEVEDPAGASVEKVRQIRDAIRVRVELLLAELGVPRGA